MDVENMSRLSRLIAITTSLQTKKIVTATELSEKYEVSVRTIYRDIKSLQDAGIPVYMVDGRGYSIMRNFFVPPIIFTDDEANALITAEKLVEKNKDKSLQKNYKSALEKVKAILRSDNKEKLDKLTDRMLYIRDAGSQNSSFLSSLQASITNCRMMEIEYLSLYKREKTERKIEPLALYNTSDNWIVIAWCHRANNYREFRLDRIKKVLVLAENYVRKFELTAYFQEKIKTLETPDIQLSSNASTFVSKSNNIMESKRLVGIAVRTANDGQAVKDIPALWGQFMGTGVQNKIPNKLSSEIYCVYTEYESDHLAPYTAFLGMEVAKDAIVPADMREVILEAGDYKQFVSIGNLQQGSVFNTWQEIWSTDLKRSYVTDYEVYGAKAANPENAEVDIFIGLKTKENA